MHSISAPRRVIRGYKALKQYTGFGETRTRELMAAGRHPLPIKGDRSCCWFEDEVAQMQAELIKQRDAMPVRPAKKARAPDRRLEQEGGACVAAQPHRKAQGARRIRSGKRPRKPSMTKLIEERGAEEVCS
jgi:predicted DNA-binding transcriptional regulator AlpA